MSERERELFTAYHLASRIFDVAYELGLASDSADTHWELLKDIASGKTTVATLAEDLRDKGLPERLLEFYREVAGRKIADDKAIAAAIIRGFDEMRALNADQIRDMLPDQSRDIFDDQRGDAGND